MKHTMFAFESQYLDPESMATPTVQNCPNFFSEATLIPLSSTVILVSSVNLLAEM